MKRKIPLCSISKQKSAGQKPANVNFRKSEEEITDKTGTEIKKAGFSECCKNDFPVPGKPEFVKNKGKGSVRNYTLFSDTDFRELVEEQFFIISTIEHKKPFSVPQIHLKGLFV